MYGLAVDRVSLGRKPISRVLALFIKHHAQYGKIVIICDKPVTMLSSVRRQWLREIRRVEIERARTLRPVKNAELSMQLVVMKDVSFSCKASQANILADVTFLSSKAAVSIAPDCRYMCIACAPPKLSLHLMTSWMPRHGLVVLYE